MHKFHSKNVIVAEGPLAFSRDIVGNLLLALFIELFEEQLVGMHGWFLRASPGCAFIFQSISFTFPCTQSSRDMFFRTQQEKAKSDTSPLSAPSLSPCFGVAQSLP